jgi:hypothetical protein
VKGHTYPIDAVRFMHDEQLAGRLVVSFNWAQYALAALAPEVQVSFDGRYDTCYPQQVVDMNFDFLLGEHGGKRFRHPESGAVDPRKVLSYGEPNLLLVDRSYAQSREVIDEVAAKPDSEWKLLYQDKIAQLWGRRAMYDDPASPHFLPPSRRSIGDTIVTASAPWPAFPHSSSPAQVAGRDRATSPSEGL